MISSDNKIICNIFIVFINLIIMLSPTRFRLQFRLNFSCSPEITSDNILPLVLYISLQDLLNVEPIFF